MNSLSSHLTWTHYKALVRIDDTTKRDFYLAEAGKNAWTVGQLERQINSLLYECLLMSQDKESVLAIAQDQRKPTQPHQDLGQLQMYVNYYDREIRESYESPTIKVYSARIKMMLSSAIYCPRTTRNFSPASINCTYLRATVN